MTSADTYDFIYYMKANEKATPLKRALSEKRLTNTWLANQLAVTDSTVSRWKNGHATVPKVKRSRVAQLLDMPEEELFTAKRSHIVDDSKNP